MVGIKAHPTQVLGGVLVPVPRLVFTGLSSDAGGGFSLPVTAGATGTKPPAIALVQVLVPSGGTVEFSNAIEVTIAR